MNRVASLAEAGRSVTAKFHELRLKYWSPGLDLVCCVEGGDDIEFYIPDIRSSMNVPHERMDFVNCGGKGVVLALRKSAEENNWNLSRVGFFVDRDLDDFIRVYYTSTQVYVTDYYSIESHACDPDFFDHVWRESFRLSLGDARYPVWKIAYFEGARRVANILRPLHYIAIAAKRAGSTVDFEKVKIEEWIKIDADGVVNKSRDAHTFSFKDVYQEPWPLKKEVQQARRCMSNVDYRTWLRGKFLLWYAITFIARMKSSLSARGADNRVVVRTHFNMDYAVPLLCTRTSTPHSLQAFLDNWVELRRSMGSAPTGHQ